MISKETVLKMEEDFFWNFNTFQISQYGIYTSQLQL